MPGARRGRTWCELTHAVSTSLRHDQEIGDDRIPRTQNPNTGREKPNGVPGRERGVVRHGAEAELVLRGAPLD